MLDTYLRHRLFDVGMTGLETYLGSLLEMKVLLFAERKEGSQASSLIFVYATLLVIALL